MDAGKCRAEQCSGQGRAGQEKKIKRRKQNKTNREVFNVLTTFTNYNATGYRGSSLIRALGEIVIIKKKKLSTIILIKTRKDTYLFDGLMGMGARRPWACQHKRNENFIQINRWNLRNVSPSLPLICTLVFAL
ncbi:hypothetical protein V6Z11_A07G156700 [Gossypium hirsutum]